MWSNEYGTETADYDPREDEEQAEQEPAPEVPPAPGSYWDQALSGRLISPAVLLATTL